MDMDGARQQHAATEINDMTDLKEGHNIRRQDIHVSLWDSLESDTESLVQEKVYQLELQKRIGSEGNNVCSDGALAHNKYPVQLSTCHTPYEEHNIHANNDVLHDNSALTPQNYVKGKPTNANSDQSSPRQPRKAKDTRLVICDDDYAGLRYDPDWRRNFTGTRFLEEMKPSVSLDSFEESEESLADLEDVTRRGRRTIIVNDHTVVKSVMTDERDSVRSQPPPPPHSFHLHPQVNKHVSPTPELQSSPVPSDSTASLSSDGSAAIKCSVKKSSCGSESLPYSLERQRNDCESGEPYNRESEKWGRDKGAMREKHIPDSSVKKKTHRQSNTKRSQPTEDIVERNKATLGLSTPKHGSYLKVHRQRENRSHDVNQVLESTDEIACIGCQESQDDILDPELMWLQKTQKLKVTQSHRGNKAKRREGVHETTHGEKRPQAHGSRTRHQPKVDLSPSTETPPVKLEAALQHLVPAELYLNDETDSNNTPDTIYQQSQPPAPPPAAPTLNLNINLSAPAKLVQPYLSHDQNNVLALVTPPRAPWTVNHSVYNSSLLSPYISHHLAVPYGAAGLKHFTPQATVSPSGSGPGQNLMSSSVFQATGMGHSGEPVLYDHEKIHSDTRITGLKWCPSSPGESRQNTNEGLQQYEESLASSCTAKTHISGSYPVLPPIGKSNVSNSELSPEKARQRLNAIPRSSSEGYLTQMEKQRQLRAKASYKAYSITDYKSLEQDIKLGGLGPANTVPEETAEKIRRQKLYSNVIREQNKKISRIPFLPARNPVGNDNKDVVPRRKALEYAKTIAKPRALPESKEKKQRVNLTERAQCVGGAGLSQLATLEILRKRHEEEKQAVAHFKVVHAI